MVILEGFLGRGHFCISGGSDPRSASSAESDELRPVFFLGRSDVVICMRLGAVAVHRG